MGNSFDWIVLERYLADDMRPGDQELVDAWSTGHQSRASFVQALIAERDRRLGEKPAWDIDALTDRIADRTSPTPIKARSESETRAPRRYRGARRTRSDRPWARAAGIAATIVIVGTAGLVASHEWSQKTQRTRPAPKMREYATTRGQLASIYLADGTRVVLAPESRLHVPESIADRSVSSQTATGRDVTLEGAAYFEVVHDANRPFSVATAAGVARDLGTEFEVRAYVSARPMQVTVVSGVVELQRGVQDARPIATLRRGDRGTLSSAGNFTLAQNVDLRPTLAWTKGSLVFNRIPVSEVVLELSRWYDLDIRLSQDIDPNRRLVLTLDNESAKDALNLVALSLGLRAEEQGRLVTLYPR